jgi:hypothetical protein
MSESGATEDEATERGSAPAVRATRGSALLTYARRQWPGAYEGTRDPGDEVLNADPYYQTLNDVVHAAVSDVPGRQLPNAIGSLLGTLAADVVVERAVEGGVFTSSDEIETMIGELVEAVRVRHYGEE